MNAFSCNEIISLIGIYLSAEYNPRGASDLFAFNKKTGDKKFIEVKSYTDSLRYEQLVLASSLINKVGDCFSIAYVLPNNYEDLMKNKTIKASGDLAKKHLQKLLNFDASKIYDEYSKATDKALFATNNYGVNFNCLAFFLNKTCGKNISYDARLLDFGGSLYSMDEYLGWLEAAWAKLKPSATTR